MMVAVEKGPVTALVSQDLRLRHYVHCLP